MRAVNLLPRDAERTGAGSGRRLPLMVAGGGIAVVTALCFFLFLSASGAVGDTRAELALTESALAAIPKPGDESAPPGIVVQERADRVAALSAALSSRIAVDRALRELSYVLPADAWLTGLIANAPKDAAEAAPGTAPAPASAGASGVTIQGATFSHESVARVLGRLAVLPSLENVHLTASALIQPQADDDDQAKSSQKKQRPLVTFTIEADLRSGDRP